MPRAPQQRWPRARLACHPTLRQRRVYATWWGMLGVPVPVPPGGREIVAMKFPRLSWDAWLDLVLPPVCALCGDEPESGDLCRRCDRAILSSWPAAAIPCRRCGMPVPKISPRAAGACSVCRSVRYEFDSVFALAVYQGAVREAVLATKRAGSTALPRALGQRLADSLGATASGWQPELITFVPTHVSRRLTRGGSGGCERIAVAVGRRLGVPIRPLLRTTRRVAKQSLLPDDQRRDNVRGAFALKKSYASRKRCLIQGRRLLLVDDVLTTGATASEVARILKAAGAASVDLAIVARAVRR